MGIITFKKASALFVSIVLIGIVGYSSYQNYQLTKGNSILSNTLLQTKNELSSTIKITSKTISALEENLTRAEEERDNLTQDLKREQDRMNAFQSQIQTITDMVGIFEQLHELDPELLKKYSKTYFLNENYVPQNLAGIDRQYVYREGNEEKIHEEVSPFLKDLLEKATQSEIDIKVISAYRSSFEQAKIKSAYTITYGKGANQFSADQGYSEHQLGTTIDFTTSKIGSTLLSFKNTATYEWLLENAHEYGFALSYPENNIYYIFEPWHWRFVGKEMAIKLHQEGKYFYELSQNVIDGYFLSIFDK